MKNPELFKRTAKFWAQYFGNSNLEARDETFSALIKKLKDMGLEEVLNSLIVQISVPYFRNKHYPLLVATNGISTRLSVPFFSFFIPCLFGYIIRSL